MPQFKTAATPGSAQEARRADAGDPAAIVEAAVAELHDLGAAPDAVRRIVRITSDGEATIDELRSAICREPAVAVRVLKVVNSAFYGLRGDIDSINRAITLLGFEAVRQIALATTILPLFRRNQLHSAFDVHELGQHCLAVAAGSSLLAERSGIAESEPAFLAGLLHDVGILVEIRTRRAAFAEALGLFHDGDESEPAPTFRAAERARLGADHEQFGEALCRRWRFPETICHAARHHHRPGEAGPLLTGIVHLADVLAARAGMGYTGTVETAEPAPGLLHALGLTPDDLVEVRQELPEAVREAEHLIE